MDNKIISEMDNTETSKLNSERKNDLSTRERVNFVLSISLMEALRKKANDIKIPMSRIVDAALMQYLDGDSSLYYSSSIDKGITLQHLIEILLFTTHNSDETNGFLDILSSYFTQYTFSSCLFKKQSSKPIVGTKIILYISDNNVEEFERLLDDISILEYISNIKIFLDGIELHL